ncbi:MAG: protein kinase [Deltaproteobacteria bacterium]|nr:protein kinase [Deltaproteobacteria bacterium]
MSSEPAQILTAGQPFGRYQVVRLIGVGGMAEVYEAYFPALRKRVAIKVLNTKAEADSDAVRRFLREGEAAARIRHPHVVEVFDLGTEHGIAYLVMELLEGEDLGSLLDRERQLSFQRMADILIPAAAGVAAAHDEGIVHRDLKPENVFLARSREGTWEPKIVDFGISKLSDPTAALGLTATTAFLGTPYYVSPEQAHGAKSTDARGDQYALGVIAYECVTGQRPFQGETFLALMHAIVRGVYPPISAFRPDVPPALEQAVARAMSGSPAHRFESVRAFARELLPLASPPIRAYWEPRLQQTQSGQTYLPAHTPYPAPHLASTSPIGPALTPSGSGSYGGQGPVAPTMASPLPGSAPTPVGLTPRGRPASTLGASVRDVPVGAPRGSRVGIVVAGLAVAGLAAGALVFTILLATSSGEPATRTPATTTPTTTTATAPAPTTAAPTTAAPTTATPATGTPAPATTTTLPVTTSTTTTPAPLAPLATSTPATTTNPAPAPVPTTTPATPTPPTATTTPASAPTAAAADSPDRSRARRTTPRRTTSAARSGSWPVRIGTRGAPIVPR